MPLALPIEKIKAHYTVVVVGSGYGGAIAASRMARAGQTVCLLERGREIEPGSYPNTLAKAAREMQTDAPEGHAGSRTGLFDFRVNPDINVVLGCGLGGTSLINANVGLRAEPWVYADAEWPAAFRGDAARLEDGYRRAEEVLRPQPVPESYPAPPKMEALQKSAAAMNAKWYRTPIYVTFEDPAGGVNAFGTPQNKCIGCGDCVSGCNYHAKNTTLMNYLPDAVNFGAEIFTGAVVGWVERRDGQWLVHYQTLEDGREKFGAPDMFVSADVVVLGAGTLGSTEILLRSAAKGLALSAQVGERFTGNGDVLGFGYNTGVEIDGLGYGDNDPRGREMVGPCITSVIDLRDGAGEEGMVIEEGSAPGAIGTLLPVGLQAAAALGGNRPKDMDEAVREAQRHLESLLAGPYHGAIRNTQTYLIMTHDSDRGRMYLEKDRLRIDWPGVGSQKIFDRANENLKKATDPLGGVYTPNPMWHSLQQKALVSVHPLGGCAMGDRAELGVVNHKGQAFSTAAGEAVYEGLYVSDGAVIPRPLGVNPSLTIAAVAERTCALMAEDRGWRIDYSLPSRPRPAMAPATTGIQFTETMKGFWFAGAEDFETGAKRGEAAGNPMEFTLTVRGGDLDAMLREPGHEARMAGTVTAPALSAKPLTVNGGVFNLFVVNPDQVETRNMRYRMTLESEEGRKWYFEGFKTIHDRPVWDSWGETTTLYITLYEGGEGGAAAGKGILHIAPADFARQMTTMQVTNAVSAAERLEATARFGRFFAQTLFDSYGGIFAGTTEFNPEAPPRQMRALRAGAPEVYAFPARDGVPLRLTRYRGGDKGPVMLSHGLGVSSLIFSLDTIGTNLLEYLYAQGYDVWLLDFRNSIALPASKLQSSGDDVALNDYPAAVDQVRELTGARDVQMVVHCWGSTTFFMAMLAGLEGVRSVVSSQIATHVVAPTATHLKTGLHVPSFLDALGVKTLTAFASTNEDWEQRVFDAGLRLYPTAVKERCDNRTCHRITFLYAPLYDHAQMNELQHETLYETFGVANMKAFEHLALLTNKGRLLNFKGEDVYLPHLERLALPITFIHGADNECFVPESTQLTFDLLRKTNGTGYYDRHVIPGYGHIDCIFGKNAWRDVFPIVAAALDKTARPVAAAGR